MKQDNGLQENNKKTGCMCQMISTPNVYKTFFFFWYRHPLSVCFWHVIFLPASPHVLCIFDLWNVIFVHSLHILSASLTKISESVGTKKCEKKLGRLQQGYFYISCLHPVKGEEWLVTEAVGSSLGLSLVLCWPSLEEFWYQLEITS